MLKRFVQSTAVLLFALLWFSGQALAGGVVITDGRVAGTTSCDPDQYGTKPGGPARPFASLPEDEKAVYLFATLAFSGYLAPDAEETTTAPAAKALFFNPDGTIADPSTLQGCSATAAEPSLVVGLLGLWLLRRRRRR